ncbi:MAG: competence protein CoiA family protein [Culicoidibacterales bacterium]
MFLAKNECGVVIASQHAKKTETYYCLECKQQVQLRMSRKGNTYFAHENRHHHGGEGQLHQQIKQHLYALFPSIVFEQPIGDLRADIWTEDVTIEIQVSAITKRQVQQRQTGYGEQLIWLFGPNTKFQQVHWQCGNYLGKFYRYQQAYCECFSSIHPLTAQKVLYVKQYINWDSFFITLARRQQNCLTVRQFNQGVDYFEWWRQTYSTRYAKVGDEYAQVLYRWQIRSEQLPIYVGMPIPTLQWRGELPIIWQGEYCFNLRTIR